MLIEIRTQEGARKVRVCDYCRTVCIPSGRFCSGQCARKWREFLLADREKERLSALKTPEEPRP